MTSDRRASSTIASPDAPRKASKKRANIAPTALSTLDIEVLRYFEELSEDLDRDQDSDALTASDEEVRAKSRLGFLSFNNDEDEDDGDRAVPDAGAHATEYRLGTPCGIAFVEPALAELSPCRVVALRAGDAAAARLLCLQLAQAWTAEARVTVLARCGDEPSSIARELLSLRSRVPVTRIERRDLCQLDWAPLAQAASDLSNLRLSIGERCDDLHSLGECLREAAESGAKFAVIDPLALLHDDSPKAVLALLQALATKHAMAIVVVFDAVNWDRLPARRPQLPRTPP